MKTNKDTHCFDCGCSNEKGVRNSCHACIFFLEASFSGNKSNRFYKHFLIKGCKYGRLFSKQRRKGKYLQFGG